MLPPPKPDDSNPNPVAFDSAVGDSDPYLVAPPTEPPRAAHAPETQRAGLPHEQLDVYWLALDLTESAHALARRLPPTHSALADRLLRSALAPPLHIAKAASTPPGAEKHQHLDNARLRASECAAAAHIAVTLRLAPPDQVAHLLHLAALVAATSPHQLHPPDEQPRPAPDTSPPSN